MTDRPAQTDGIVQPVVAGVLAAVVGFASAFAIVLEGLRAVGASPAQAASGLLAVTLVQGVLSIGLSVRYRLPISIAWSTPGAALLATVGPPVGGFDVVVGAFLVAALLVVVAGSWQPLGRLVTSIPIPLASAMLAGILLSFCLAPVAAVTTEPLLALPMVLIWAIGLKFFPRYAVALGLVAAVVAVLVTVPLPPGILAWPAPVLVTPDLTIAAVLEIALPLFIVTMASQNIPGLTVLRANGYEPPAGKLFAATGIGSGVTAVFGGHTVNLAAITAALCAGPEAHPKPARRYIAGISNGVAYLVFALGVGLAAAFVAASPPILIQGVAGLALLGTFGNAMRMALADDATRLPAVATFVTTASGVTVLGIGGAFWGLIVGGALYLVLRE